MEFTHMGSKWPLHMEPSPLPVLTDSSSEGLAPDAPLHPAAEGKDELNRVYSTDSKGDGIHYPVGILYLETAFPFCRPP